MNIYKKYKLILFSIITLMLSMFINIDGVWAETEGKLLCKWTINCDDVGRIGSSVHAGTKEDIEFYKIANDKYYVSVSGSRMNAFEISGHKTTVYDENGEKLDDYDYRLESKNFCGLLTLSLDEFIEEDNIEDVYKDGKCDKLVVFVADSYGYNYPFILSNTNFATINTEGDDGKNKDDDKENNVKIKGSTGAYNATYSAKNDDVNEKNPNSDSFVCRYSCPSIYDGRELMYKFEFKNDKTVTLSAGEDINNLRVNNKNGTNPPIAFDETISSVNDCETKMKTIMQCDANVEKGIYFTDKKCDGTPNNDVECKYVGDDEFFSDATSKEDDDAHFVEIYRGEYVEEDFNCGSLGAFGGYLDSAFTLIKIAAPLLAIILGIVDFITAMAASDEDTMKKSWSKFVKRLIIAACVFVVPYIIELLLDIAGFSDTNCGIR